jgi:hypothetical protein
VPKTVPGWLTIIISLIGSGLVSLAVAWWTRRPLLVMEVRGWKTDEAFDIEAEHVVRVISFSVWLGNNGSTIARGVRVEAFLDDERVAVSHALDVAPNSELQKRFSFGLRDPQEVEGRLERGELRPTFHGRTLRARARAQNIRREMTVEYTGALEPSEDDALYI